MNIAAREKRDQKIAEFIQTPITTSTGRQRYHTLQEASDAFGLSTYHILRIKLRLLGYDKDFKNQGSYTRKER